MLWFLYTWFSIVAFEVVLAYTILNNDPWCNAQNFLAQIKKTKKQYRVFDERNFDSVFGHLLFSEAEEICKNMTMCYHCVLPEPKSEEETDVLIQLAEHCGDYDPFPQNPFLGIEEWKSRPSRLRWRSDNSNVILYKPIECSYYYHGGACFQIIDSEWCRVSCENHRSRIIICEMKPQKPGPSTEPDILKPPYRDRPSSGSEARDLSVLTIVAIAVGSLGWLLLLCVSIAFCVYCFYSSRKRTNQIRENTSQNAGQNLPMMGSAPQTLQSQGNISQTTVSQPAYTQGQPGPVYTQAPPSRSTPAPANTDVQQASGSSESPEPHNQKRVTCTVS